MKILFVGDMHCQVSNILESQKLIDFVAEQARKNNADKIVFLGDQFHTHSVVRLEVISFWTKYAIPVLTSLGKQIVFLVGNHDICGDKQKEREMSANDIFKQIDNVVVVDSYVNIDNILYCPYMSNKEDFVKMSNSYPEIKTLVCHQTFDGCQYDNGFYAPDGIDPKLISQETIISGHFHTRSNVGKINYVGSPRWLTMSDANHEKSICLAETLDGRILKLTNIDTKSVCTPIYSLTIKEGEDLPKIEAGSRVYVELVGSTSWISKTKKKLPDFVGVKVSPTDRVIEKAKKSTITTIWSFLESCFVPLESCKKESIKEVFSEVGFGQ